MEKSQKRLDSLDQFLETHSPGIEKALKEHMPGAPFGFEKQFNAAVDQALATEETRVMPILVMLGAELVDGDAGDVLPVTAAVEFIRSSAQVFDKTSVVEASNLNQNADSLVKTNDEDIAVSVGIGLLNAAYPLVFVNHAGMPERAMQAHAEIVECVGARLIGGENSRNMGDFEESESSNASALIRLSLRLGAILSGADYIELANVSRFAEQFGNVYLLWQKQDIPSVSLESAADGAKATLVENFPSNEGRTCLIQLTDSIAYPSQ